jgi:large subunit ribosomal protein L13
MFVSIGKGVTGSMRTYQPRGRVADSLQAGPSWFVVDATNQVLGRLATRVARLLIGKDKPSFTPHLDCGDHVVIVNAGKIRLTGNKLEQKIYRHHSGYPGGLKEVPAKRLRVNRADWMVREAILGMLPKNKLRAHRAKKLRVYLDEKGLARHAGQKPQALAQ